VVVVAIGVGGFMAAAGGSWHFPMEQTLRTYPQIEMFIFWFPAILKDGFSRNDATKRGGIFIKIIPVGFSSVASVASLREKHAFLGISSKPAGRFCRNRRRSPRGVRGDPGETALP
jgi:hypothetical protein